MANEDIRTAGVSTNFWYGQGAPLDAKTLFLTKEEALETILAPSRYVGMKFTVQQGRPAGEDNDGNQLWTPLEYWFKKGITNDDCVIYTPQELPELFGDTLKAEKEPVYKALEKRGEGEYIEYHSREIPMTINEYADRQPRAFCHPKFIFDKVQFEEDKRDKDGTYYVLDKVARGVTL